MVAAPNDVNLITDCFKWKFSMPDVGDGETIEKRFGYQLLCEDGSEATKPKIYMPKAAGTFDIDFQREIKSRLKGFVPFINSDADRDAPEMKKKYKVKYWEVHIDLENCEEPQIVGEAETGLITAINGAQQHYQTFDAANDVLLSYRPKCMYVCKDSKDYLYFCGTAILVRQVTDVDGNVTSTVTSHGSADTVTVVAVGPIIEGNNVDSVKYFIADGSGGVQQEITYKVKCCHHDNRDIYFQGMGGLELMSFCRTQSEGYSSQQNEACHYTGCAAPNTTTSRFKSGNRIVDKSSRQNLILSTQITDTKDARRYMGAFQSSKVYFLKECDDAGNDYFVKFILDPASITTYVNGNCELTVTVQGKVEQEFNCPNF